MEYVPFEELAGRPNVVVDGPATEGTVLVLSHWVGSGSPEELAADSSTQIVFRFLEQGKPVDAGFVSNNHFDEDGLSGIWSLLNPDEAMPRRALIEDVASAGDFGVWHDRRAARIAFALFGFQDPDRSPFGAEAFAGPYERTSSFLYTELLARYRDLLDAPDAYRELWQDEDERLARDEARIEAGSVTIDEDAALDLAVVTVHDEAGAVHPFAIHPRTDLLRIATIDGSRYELRYRYETWVRFVSRPTAPRRDLSDLAARLSDEDDVRWSFDGVGALTPALHADGPSRLSAEAFLSRVRETLAS